MLNADYLSKLGFFIAKDFLDDDLCAKIRSEMCLGSNIPAMVTSGKEEIIKENVRKNKVVQVSASSISFFKSRLLAIKPILEEHFKLSLTDCQEPQFLAYKQGDFFIFHSDRSDEQDKPEYVKARQISVVIFLNSAASEYEIDSYSGGSLKFYAYDIVSDSSLKNAGFSLSGETGLLIAFRSDIRHQVQTVTSGERFTIVSWFF
jgi:predicted 2-oxoglutarate/Fe(II)-dependent dioxygenase YbiX